MKLKLLAVLILVTTMSRSLGFASGCADALANAAPCGNNSQPCQACGDIPISEEYPSGGIKFFNSCCENGKTYCKIKSKSGSLTLHLLITSVKFTWSYDSAGCEPYPG